MRGRRSNKAMLRRGLLAVYKPSGVTSADVIGTLKSTLLSQPGLEQSGRRLKVGHGGTLDKAAQGVLVVGIGEDCKKLGVIQNNSVKSYEVVGCLGLTTDTLDSDGVVIERKACTHITHDLLTNALHRFHGVVTQTPPLYSALKHKGRRLSDYARDSHATETTLQQLASMKKREVDISAISLLDYSLPSFTLMVRCSSGTYIRSLVRDIAETLDTVGYMSQLTRTSVGPFTLQHALRPDQDGLWAVDTIQTAVNNCQTLLS